MVRTPAILILFLAAAAQAALKVHLYSPWAADPARLSPPSLIMIQGKDPGYYPGAAMIAEGGDWFVHAFKNDAPAPWDGFKFVDYIPAGGNPYANGSTYDNAGDDFTMGDVFLTPGAQEVWIIPQGPGKPPLITDIPPKAKAVYLFNPWPETAPAIRTAGDTSAVPMRLSPDKARCGWYVHFFPAKAYSVSFRSMVGAQSYGQGGLGSDMAIDLAASFAASDTVYLLPDPLPGGPPSIRSAFPAGVAGICAFPLAVTIRDFSAKHTDFEKDGMEGKLTKGMVAPILPADKKPAQGPVPFFQKHFDKWFRTDSANADATLRNFETCRDLPMAKDRYGYWGHDSYDDPDHSYFPIDDFNRFGETSASHYRDRATGSWVDGKQHNFHFCMEMHANFTYRKGQVFRFSGDDDVWVYIDNRLAIDIGGTHGPVADSVFVDTMKLTPGRKYDFDLFFCERKTQGSNLLIQTSIFFEQDQTVWARRSALGPGKDQYDIFEIVSGDRSCGAAQGGDTVAAPSSFTLSGPSADPARELPAGTSFGGIAIDPLKTRVVVDTARITGLRPGEYAITYLSGRSGKGGVIRFTVGGSLSVEFEAKPPVRVLKGTAVPATVRAVLNGAPDKRAEPFRLQPQSGLTAFEDSALTLPITAGTRLTTDAATGAKRIWVTATIPGAYSLDLMGGAGAAATMDTYANLVFFADPIAVRKAWMEDEDGDGRIETVRMEFSGSLPAAPDRLDFTLADGYGAAGAASVAAAQGGIVLVPGSGNRVMVAFKPPFPFGLTSLAAGGGGGKTFRQDGIPLLDGTFALEDSAAPVITAAEILEPDSAQPLKRVLITYSEAIQAPPADGNALVFKREDREFAGGLVRVQRLERTGERKYVFYLDSASEAFPIAGDSVAIPMHGGTRDLLGNAPARKLFRKLEGSLPGTPPMDVFVTFPNETRELPSGGAEPEAGAGTTAAFIPVGRDGAALPGNGIGKCSGCAAGRNGGFSGPVFHLRIPAPTAYGFRIFSNLGILVAEGNGRIEAEDLPLLDKETGPAGLKYRARIVWTGRTPSGGKAGTGAYILLATLRSDGDADTGAPPATETRKIVFGLIRGRP
jgi:fibro-slime domain-containing protein